MQIIKILVKVECFRAVTFVFKRLSQLCKRMYCGHMLLLFLKTFVYYMSAFSADVACESSNVARRNSIYCREIMKLKNID